MEGGGLNRDRWHRANKGFRFQGADRRKDIKREPQNRRMSNVECRRKEFYRFYKKETTND